MPSVPHVFWLFLSSRSRRTRGDGASELVPAHHGQPTNTRLSDGRLVRCPTNPACPVCPGLRHAAVAERQHRLAVRYVIQAAFSPGASLRYATNLIRTWCRMQLAGRSGTDLRWADALHVTESPTMSGPPISGTGRYAYCVCSGPAASSLGARSCDPGYVRSTIVRISLLRSPLHPKDSGRRQRVMRETMTQSRLGDPCAASCAALGRPPLPPRIQKVCEACEADRWVRLRAFHHLEQRIALNRH